MTNDILQALARHAPLTINELASRLDAEWRTVAKEANRLYAQGVVEIVGDKPLRADDDGLRVPQWRLTSAGELAAAEARAAQRMEEASDDES